MSSHGLARTNTFHSSCESVNRKMAANATRPRTNAHRTQPELRNESALTGRYAADSSRFPSTRGACVTDNLEVRHLLRPPGRVKALSRAPLRSGSVRGLAGAVLG